jgi:hypothetical protein
VGANDRDYEELVGSPAPEIAELVGKLRQGWQKSEDKGRRTLRKHGPIVLHARSVFLSVIPERAPKVLADLQAVLDLDKDFFRRHDLREYPVARQRMTKLSPETADAFDGWLKTYGLDRTLDDWAPRVAIQTLLHWATLESTERFQYWNDALDPETSLDAQSARAGGTLREPLPMLYTTTWRQNVEVLSDFRHRARADFEKQLEIYVGIMLGLDASDQASEGNDDEMGQAKGQRKRKKPHKPHQDKLRMQAEWLVDRHFLGKSFDKIADEAAYERDLGDDSIRRRVREYADLIGLVDSDKE